MPAPPPPDSRAPARTGPDPLVALADRCVQCGLCLPHCPTYQLDRNELESPRGRIAYVRALATGQLAPTPVGDTHLDHCLGCRRCESACPAGVAYGDLLVQARGRQFPRRRPPLRVRAAAWLLGHPAWLGPLMAVYRWLPGLPARWRPLPRPPAPIPATPRPTAAGAGTHPPAAVFLGCIARAYESPARASLLRLLAAAGLTALVPDRQACCGAAAAHLGDQVEAARLAGLNRGAFRDQATVYCLASGCQDALATSLSGVAEVRDPLQALAEVAPALRFRPAPVRIALHLPCTYRDAAALRALLARVPGLDLVELPDRGCCGAAGLHQLAEPGRAAELRAPLLQALAASGVRELLSANIGCRLHLSAGTTLPVRHPLEFLAEQLA